MQLKSAGLEGTAVKHRIFTSVVCHTPTEFGPKELFQENLVLQYLDARLTKINIEQIYN